MKTTSQQALVAGTVVLLIGILLSPSIADPKPSPAPSAPCWIYSAVYSVSKDGFIRGHATAAERKEVGRWAKPASTTQDHLVRMASPWAAPPEPSEMHLLRWMRDPQGGVYVFVMRPLRPKYSPVVDGVSPWIALNVNVWINPLECEIGAYPTA